MRMRSIFVGLILTFPGTVLMQAQEPVGKAWNILKQGAADRSFERRARTRRALALVTGNQTAQQMAERALSDERPEVRGAAASSLGQMGAKTSIPKVQQTEKDKDVAAVLSATDALFRLGDPALLKAVVALLDDENDAVKFCAAATVVRLSAIRK